METLYSRLYEKYTKLKARKFEELEKPNKEQEMTFITYVTAAEELIEHLRSEKERLSEQVNGLRNELNALRSKEYEQSLEYQNLLMEDNQKLKELKEENERLLKLQREGLLSNTNDSDTPMLNAPVDNPNGSENTPMRSKNNAKTQIVNSSEVGAYSIEHPGPADSVGQSGKKFTSNEPLVRSRLVYSNLGASVFRFNFWSILLLILTIYAAWKSTPAQVLIGALVGLKLSASYQVHGISISALHESSGYAFSLTLVYKAGKKEADLMYKVISLGT